MVDGGRPLEVLDSILEQYRVVQHGVAMYFGSADKFDRTHLKRLKRLDVNTLTSRQRTTTSIPTITSITFRIIASGRFISPATRSSKSTFSTRTIILCSTPYGRFTPMPSTWSATRPRYSSGTIEYPLLTKSIMKPSKPTNSATNSSPRPLKPPAEITSREQLRELQRVMAGVLFRPLTPQWGDAEALDGWQPNGRCSGGVHQTERSAQFV